MLVSDSAASAGRRAASSFLRELLRRPGPYRRQWEQHVVRTRPGEINQLAVAEVLARRLWSYPRGAGDADVLPHQLKDTVGRGLSGRLLSRSTLALFIEAFAISDADADRLWRLWEGSGTISVLSGSRAVTPRTEHELASIIGPRRHRTVSMHDHMTIGVSGRPVRGRTLQVIEAIMDGVDRIPFMQDTKALTVEVGQGCTGLSGDLFQVSDELFVTSILLARTLDVGQTATLEYQVTYQYPGDPDDPGEREHRRAVMSRLENFDTRVEFHPDRLPTSIWWAIWDGVSGPVLEQEAVTLDAQHSVHRYLRFIEKTVAGFHWTW
jgi:hypothetical protein